MPPLSAKESIAMRSVPVLFYFVVKAPKIASLKTNMYGKQRNFCAPVLCILTAKMARTDIKRGVANSSLEI